MAERLIMVCAPTNRSPDEIDILRYERSAQVQLDARGFKRIGEAIRARESIRANLSIPV